MLGDDDVDPGMRFSFVNLFVAVISGAAGKLKTTHVCRAFMVSFMNVRAQEGWIPSTQTAHSTPIENLDDFREVKCDGVLPVVAVMNQLWNVVP